MRTTEEKTAIAGSCAQLILNEYNYSPRARHAVVGKPGYYYSAAVHHWHGSVALPAWGTPTAPDGAGARGQRHAANSGTAW